MLKSRKSNGLIWFDVTYCSAIVVLFNLCNSSVFPDLKFRKFDLYFSNRRDLILSMKSQYKGKFAEIYAEKYNWNRMSMQELRTTVNYKLLQCRWNRKEKWKYLGDARRAWMWLKRRSRMVKASHRLLEDGSIAIVEVLENLDWLTRSRNFIKEKEGGSRGMKNRERCSLLTNGLRMVL